nr:c-type cytochrome biogenesis protein CcmI [Methylovulum psychrotolerans]
MLFWLFAALMVLAALALIVPPLWRQRAVAAADMDGRNIAIAKIRLAELQEQREVGLLSPAQYTEQRTELELALADDLDIAAPTAAATPQSRWLVYALVLLIPLLAVSLYADLGTYQAVEPTPEMLATTTPTAATPSIEQINQMVAKLAERMKTNPNDAEGWVMLGKSYKYLQQFPKAADAFGQAYRLLGDNSEVMLLYADALAFANNEQMAGKPAELAFKVLAKEPDNVTALWYGGMAKAQAGEAVEGVKLWRKLAALLPPGSQAQQETQAILAKLEATVPGGVPKEAGTVATPAPAAGVTLQVQVSLAASLQAAAAPDDTVFIYAQALTGPKMPLAIIRKRVADLPVTVSLSDAQAMLPTMKLSAFPSVKLLARVSKSGTATTEPGDLLGVIEPVATGSSQSQAIVIDTQVQ